MGAKNYSIETEQHVVILPEGIHIPLPAPQLPEMILNALAAINVSLTPVPTTHKR